LWRGDHAFYFFERESEKTTRRGESSLPYPAVDSKKLGKNEVPHLYYDGERGFEGEKGIDSPSKG